jgi:hypothetical protein
LALLIHQRPVVVFTIEVSGVGGTPQGTASTKMPGASISRSVALGDATLVPGSSGAMSPGLLGPYLLGSLGSAPMPIN